MPLFLDKYEKINPDVKNKLNNMIDPISFLKDKTELLIGKKVYYLDAPVIQMT